jgi:hypothetical protein
MGRVVISIHPLTGIGEVGAGDHKIVSKAEGSALDLVNVMPALVDRLAEEGNRTWRR